MAGDNYAPMHRRSLDEPEAYWAERAGDLVWTRRWDKVLDDARKPFYRWFRGGEINTCFNALDRHVDAGHGDRIALIYDSPVTGGTIRRFTYRDLRDEVARFAGVLRAQGVGKGDRVIVYMPMVPEAAIAMLACARLGAVHSVVFGGFAANELAVRIDDCQPKAIVSASCGIETTRIIPYKPLLDAAINIARHKPGRCIILQRPQQVCALTPGRDIDWAEAMKTAAPAACVPVAATDPLYILYTSGTTGQPKGVVRDNGGHAVALKASMSVLYDMKPGEVFWAASDVGWVVGHSYIVYAPLLQGCTTLLYEGKPVGTPDAGAFWRVASQHKVKALFTAPTAFRAIKREDPEGALVKRYDLGAFKALFLAGERCDPDTLHWAQRILGVPVVDHWWQTETGHAITGNPVGVHSYPLKAGSTTKPMPGWDVQALGADGHPVKPGEIGAICCRLPLPPGTFPTLWNAEERFFKAYLEEYPGWYKTGDAGMVDADGYVHIMTRVDDVINVAGHRLSTGQMEEVLASHPAVAECAVVGVGDELKGQVPLGFVVLKAGVKTADSEIVADLVKMVRERIGPVAFFKQAIVVPRLPKTRSGKILRGTMQKIADSEAWKMPATIDDPAILEEIQAALQPLGYAKADSRSAPS
ncbi:MAG: propionyl-CoA synthetase [Alphaproteobacteria bacterium]|nr:propionyl-CoA synthetase [Alphaproteobacteria bacterium]